MPLGNKKDEWGLEENTSPKVTSEGRPEIGHFGHQHYHFNRGGLETGGIKGEGKGGQNRLKPSKKYGCLLYGKGGRTNKGEKASLKEENIRVRSIILEGNGRPS